MQLYDIKSQLPFKRVEWESESALDNFLFENPAALSQALYTEEPNRLLPLGTQIASIDILYLRLPTSDNPDPGLLICEDKRGSNPELRREVLGQVIDYAATISQIDATEFQNTLTEHLNEPNLQKILNRCVRDGSLSQEDVDNGLQSAVVAQQNGNIECVICANAIPDRLLQMVKWINSAIAGNADALLLRACKVEKWESREITVVAVASALTLLENSDAGAFSESDAASLVEKASALLALPGFHVHATEVVKTEVAMIVADRAPSRNLSGPGVRGTRVAASPEEWVAKVPSKSIQQLYEELNRDLAFEKRWRPGGSIGAQLVLELPIVGSPQPLHVLRLKSSGLSFVPFGFLERNGLEDISRWARQYLAKSGVKDSEARQPSVSADDIARLENGSSSVAQFITELHNRVTQAVNIS